MRRRSRCDLVWHIHQMATILLHSYRAPPVPGGVCTLSSGTEKKAKVEAEAAWHQQIPESQRTYQKPPRQLLTAELASSYGDMVHGTGQDVSSTDVSLTGGTIGIRSLSSAKHMTSLQKAAKAAEAGAASGGRDLGPTSARSTHCFGGKCRNCL